MCFVQIIHVRHVQKDSKVTRVDTCFSHEPPGQSLMCDPFGNVISSLMYVSVENIARLYGFGGCTFNLLICNLENDIGRYYFIMFYII